MPKSPLTDVRSVEDRRVSRTSRTNNRPGRVPYELIGRSKGPSLDAPPVYRRFLAGNSETTLQPRLASLLILLLAGTAALAIGWLIALPQNAGANMAYLLHGLGALACTTVLVMLVSRWFGTRLGMVTGSVWLISIAVLGPQFDIWPATAFCLAIGLFALANVPGPRPTIKPQAAAWIFYGIVGLTWLFFGSEATVVILITCFATMLITQNIQSARFLINPIGLGILVIAVVGRWLMVRYAVDGHNTISSSLHTWISNWILDGTVAPARMIAIALVGLPPAMLAVLVGLHQGYHSTPIGKLWSCWILGPLALCALEIISYEMTLAIVFPAMCLLTATGGIMASKRLGVL